MRAARIAALVVLAALAVAGVLRWALPPLLREDVAPQYDANTAMSLAGLEVPPERESYYFYFVDRDAKRPEIAAEMAKTLEKAAHERDYLGVTGPDPARVRAVVIGALDAAGDKDLSGATLIYVGPPEDRALLAHRAGAARLDLRYVAYP